jgi:low molecular weight phosphotyrosine protein phosphatase
VHPEVVKVMRELGIDLSDRKPQKLTTELAEQADVVVTMGCGDRCPYIPGKRYVDWDLEDPKAGQIERRPGHSRRDRSASRTARRRTRRCDRLPMVPREPGTARRASSNNSGAPMCRRRIPLTGHSCRYGTDASAPRRPLAGSPNGRTTRARAGVVTATAIACSQRRRGRARAAARASERQRCDELGGRSARCPLSSKAMAVASGSGVWSARPPRHCARMA